MMESIVKSGQVCVKSYSCAYKSEPGDDVFRLSARASVYNAVDRHGHVVLGGCFKDEIAYFQEEGFIGGVNHDWDRPLGKVETASETEQGLYFTGRFTPGLSYADDAMKLIRDGVITKVSVGFRIQEWDWVKQETLLRMWESVGYVPTQQDMKNTQDRMTLVLLKGQPFEVSPTPIPAAPDADITQTNSLGGVDFLDSFTKMLEVVLKNNIALPADLREALGKIHNRDVDQPVSKSTRLALAEASAQREQQLVRVAIGEV